MTLYLRPERLSGNDMSEGAPSRSVAIARTPVRLYKTGPLARLAFLVVLFASVHFGAQHAHAETRRITFSDLRWDVRDSGDSRSGPGDNLWDNASDAVWVDDGGLHLRIRSVEGIHRSVEVITRRRLPGYGRYSFVVDAPYWEFEPYLVLGFFLYEYRGPDQTPQEYELDIEFSRWGIPDAPVGNYTVMYRPAGARSTIVPTHSFEPVVRFARTKHEIAWSEGRVRFTSWGIDSAGTLHPIATREFAGNLVHPEANQRLHINLWLFGNPVLPPAWERTVTIREVSICEETVFE